jgi:hypothetical protein
MSYDIELWSVNPPLREHLKADLLWTDAPGSWAHSTKNWQIVVSHPDSVDMEDIPDEIAKGLPGIGFLTHFNLEGKASAASIQRMISLARSMAREAHGVVLDPQQDLVMTSIGVARLQPVKREERFTALALSWWFMDGPMLTEAGRGKLLDLLERELPEALPRRYGNYEPPQFRYDKTGRAHFEEFLSSHLHDFVIVWEPHRPVIDVSLFCPDKAGGSPDGFRANRFEVSIEFDLLKQPGWQTQLRRFWMSASKLIQPVYGDVRILRHQPRSGYLAFDDPSERHPVRSWFWRGIPKQLGCAMVLGGDYQRLWPDAALPATLSDGLAFIATPNWCSEDSIVSRTGEVPEKIASPPIVLDPGTSATNYTHKSYPEQWPFDDPFAGGEPRAPLPLRPPLKSGRPTKPGFLDRLARRFRW